MNIINKCKNTNSLVTLDLITQEDIDNNKYLFLKQKDDEYYCFSNIDLDYIINMTEIDENDNKFKVINPYTTKKFTFNEISQIRNFLNNKEWGKYNPMKKLFDLTMMEGNKKIIKKLDKILTLYPSTINQIYKEHTLFLWFVKKDVSRDILKHLLNKGININQSGSDGKTALMHAVYYDHIRIIKFLLENGADINIKSESQDTALLIATGLTKKYEITKLLLENGANPNDCNRVNFSSLFYAETIKDMELLLKYGANIHHRDNNDETLLFCRNDLLTIKFLIENGIDITCRNNNGQTFIETSDISISDELIKYLLKTKKKDFKNIVMSNKNSNLLCDLKSYLNTDINVNDLRISDYFTNQPDINEKMRQILFDWLKDVSETHVFKSNIIVLLKVFSLIDNYLKTTIILRKNLQLVGITSMYIILEQLDTTLKMKKEDCIYITDNAYNIIQLNEMYDHIKNTVEYDINKISTIIDFIHPTLKIFNKKISFKKYKKLEKVALDLYIDFSKLLNLKLSELAMRVIITKSFYIFR